MTTKTGVCAVVVTYYPDMGFMGRLVKVLPQVDVLIVVDNTPDAILQQALSTQLADFDKIHFVANPANFGVAKALNQGLSETQALGGDWLLTLDQDTCCYLDIVQTLLCVKVACEPMPVVIGGNYFDTRNDRLKAPVGGECEFLDQKTVITSGCLVDVGFAQMVGGFRDDFFIDQVDHEFCLRVRRHGGRVVITRKAVMEHSVGDGCGVWIPFLGYLPNHSSLRKYYIARNSMTTIVDYWRIEPAWCIRRAIRLFLGALLMATLEKGRLSKLNAFISGVVDSILRKMGPHSRG